MSRDEAIDVEIRWPDIDWYGHVSHMALVGIAEHGRSKWLDTTLGIKPATWPYVVARLELDFRSSIRYVDHSIRCYYRPLRVGTKSVSLGERYAGPDGTTVMEAQSVIVAWDQERSVTRALTEAEASCLTSRSA